MTNFRSIPALVFLAAIAGLSQASPADKPVSTTKKASTSTDPARNHATTAEHSAKNDAELEKAIRARFAESKIAEDKFQVHVQGGRATITGNTNVLQHKGVATRLARSMGATEVINKVEPSEEARQKASDNLTKGGRRAQVKRGEARSETQ